MSYVNYPSIKNINLKKRKLEAKLSAKFYLKTALRFHVFLVLFNFPTCLKLSKYSFLEQIVAN